LAIDIAPLILIADELGMAINAPIPRVKVVPLPSETGQPWRSELSGVLVLVRLESGEGKIGIGNETEPGSPESADDSQKQKAEPFHATGTS
jgi:hypothetical protein